MVVEENTLAEATIYSTRKYDKFSYIEGNRKPTHDHVRQLIGSFSDNNSLVATRPVLVNDKFQVIDGQHRFEACRALDLPIYYIIGHNIDISHARQLNATQMGWKLKNFLDSYVASGAEQYIKFAEIQQEYPLPISTLLPYVCGYAGTNLTQNFRNGSLMIMKDKTLMYYRLDGLKSLAPYVSFWATNHIAQAYFGIIANSDNFDPERLVHKLQQGAKLDYQTGVMNFKREIERVYNWGQKTDVVRLFV